MYIVHGPLVTIETVSYTHLDLLTIISLLAFFGPVVSAFVLNSGLIAKNGSRLKQTANKIYRRMQSLGLNETELSERCSLAALHIFEDPDSPALTRDRISKILMNRQEAPARSAARVISHAELAVLASVLKVPAEWLTGQEQNRDPVVWNVFAQPERVLSFANLLQEYEEFASETLVWSRHPMHSYTSGAFAHAFNHIHFGQKLGIGNTKPLVEFSNSMDRIRRKWILRSDRVFEYANLIYQSHFEHVICGHGIFSAMSKTILSRNLDVMIDVIGNPSLKLKLLILKDDDVTLRDSAMGNYEVLGSVDKVFSVWNYHNGDLGWSEHPGYIKPHRQLLESMRKHSLFESVPETIEYLKSLRNRLTPQ
jgi:hypothetical protein